MTIKLASQLPQNSNSNGLDDIAPTLVAEPYREHVVIAVVGTAKITTDLESGAQVPTLRVRRIEVVPADEADRMRLTMRRLQEERLGVDDNTLPYEDVRDDD